MQSPFVSIVTGAVPVRPAHFRTIEATQEKEEAQAQTRRQNGGCITS